MAQARKRLRAHGSGVHPGPSEAAASSDDVEPPAASVAEAEQPSAASAAGPSGAGPPGAGGMDEVAAVLSAVRLASYAETFDEMGYDDLPFLRGLDASELRRVATEEIGMRVGHAARFVDYLSGVWSGQAS